MFDHIGLFVSNTKKSFTFFEAALDPLGIAIIERQPHLDAVIFGSDQGTAFLWMGPAEGAVYYGTRLSSNSSRPIHLSFSALSIDAVMEFHRRGIAAGGRDNGTPEDCGDGYFAAYLLDPDGNNIEAGYRPPKR